MSYFFLLFSFLGSLLFAQGYEQKNCSADTARANQLFVLGVKFQDISKLDSAALCYEQAAEIWENACPEVKGENRRRFWLRYLESKNSRGWLFYLQGKSSLGAIFYLENALEKVLPWLDPKHPSVAKNYDYAGNMYLEQGRYEEALQRHQKALAIWLANYGENHLLVGNSYASTGLVYQEQGRYAEALQYYQKALSIYLVVLGENHPNAADSYYDIGNVYSKQGRYAEALQYYQKALAIYLAALGKKHPNVADSYNSMGNVYQAQGRYAEALEYYQKALAINLAVLGENHPRAAAQYNNIGLVYKDLGRYAEALEYYQKALAINLAVLGENHPRLATQYNNMGPIYQAQGRHAEALEYYQKALAINLAVLGENHPKTVITYNQIGIAYEAQLNYREALQNYRKALECNVPNWEPAKEWDLPSPNAPMLSPQYLLVTLQKQSQTLFRACLSWEHSPAYRSYLPYALKATRYGATQLSRWRQTMRREADQIELGKQATEILGTGIACAFLMDSLGMKEQTPLKEAFFFSESNKAAALNLAIQQNEALVAAGIPETLSALQQDYKREITLCNQQLETVLKPETKEDSLKKQYYENRKFTYAAKLDSLIHALEKEYSKYYELKYATFTASVDTLQKVLAAQSPHTAVLEYFVSDTALFIFALNAKDFAAKKILLPQKELQKLINAFGRSYYLLTESQRQDSTKKQNYINAAAKLYQQLIAPVEEVIKNKELVIIPDGWLWELPFEILIKASGQAEAQKLEKLPFEKLPLFNQFHTFRYSPSATAFLRSFILPPAKGQGIFAVAPIFDFQEEKILAFPLTRGREITYPQAVVALRGSEGEVFALKRLFESRNLPVKTLLRAQAKEEVFTASPLFRYRYIHLATHGVFNRNKPSWSYLLFASPQDSVASLEKDGLLTAAECYNLKLDAELVVLSACETARGELKPGEGLVGLTRGLLYSGARSVLVSQWKVPDEATGKLMQLFYQNLLSGLSKPRALQAAKESMRKSGFAHPYYWAAFVLVGG